MSLLVDIQCASREPVPAEDDLRGWVAAAVDGAPRLRGKQPDPGADMEIAVRLVDSQEMTRLNSAYRGANGPTNVLSFPAELPPELRQPLLGDIVICAPVVRAQARQQGKALQAHWAHMAVHGTLHLLGYDHIEEADATVMESLETTILGRLDFDCPYGDGVEQSTP
ncbi:MAG: rRNA maturation RNase YbeY [Halioglobus sp.]|nr:rRNA maturation RNase YbeY [Halioglobus sp.]|tara:strand:- start:1808 stop:2308 length:501 start_codon:yes stop_codon:yes gene_type:complete